MEREFRTRWTDERLDDLAREVQILRPTLSKTAENTVRVEDLKEDMDDLWEAVNKINNSLVTGRRALVYALLGLTGTMLATLVTILYAIASGG